VKNSIWQLEISVGNRYFEKAEMVNMSHNQKMAAWKTKTILSMCVHFESFAKIICVYQTIWFLFVALVQKSIDRQFPSENKKYDAALTTLMVP
jgi:hypothetical protein